MRGAAVDVACAVSAVLAKGAPEVMEGMFIDAPTEYASMHRVYAKRGLRVLALGYKPAEFKTESEVRTALSPSSLVTLTV